MARTSGREARVDAVMALIEAGGSVRLRDAAARLGVTEMTLRRDAAVADAPLRCLGGWLVPAAVVSDYDLSAEGLRHVEAKRAAARAAVPMIPAAGRVFLDCGTTTTHLAQLLPAGVTVITHSLPVAQIVAGRDDLRLELLGGIYHPATASAHAEPPLPGGAAFDLAVMSAGGIDADGAVTCSHPHEYPIKRAAMAAARRRVILADHSKLGHRRPVVFADRTEFDAVITEP